MPTIETKSVEQVKTAIRCGMFSGALSGFQRVVHRDLCYAGIDDKTAHKVSIDYGSQLGNAMRNDDNIKTAVGKASKAGIAKMSGAFHDKLIMHNAMAVYRVIQTISDLYQKEKLLKSYAVSIENMSDRLQDYLGECKAWSMEQTWETK